MVYFVAFCDDDDIIIIISSSSSSISISIINPTVLSIVKIG